MDVLVTEDREAFADRALPFIEKDPFSTNVVAVNLGLRQAGHIAAGNALWVTALEDETVVGIAMETPRTLSSSLVSAEMWRGPSPMRSRQAGAVLPVSPENGRAWRSSPAASNSQPASPRDVRGR